MSEFIDLQDQDGVRTVTMNRPQVKNALSHEMYTAMADAIFSVADDPAIRVVLLTGAGDAFTSGNDVREFITAPPSLEGDNEPPVLRFLQAILSTPKPLIAAVNGLAVGIGTTMLLHCDLVYAADNATFCTPFIDLGLVPEAASSLLLPQIVGFRRAYEMLMLGQWLDAAKAESCGLISRVFAADELLAASRKSALKLAAKPPNALRRTKALLRQNISDVPQRIAEEGRQFGQALASAEFKEAAQAFFEKRQPDFSRCG